MQIGYARVSTQDQDLRLQYEALRQVPCDKIYEDKASGAKASREGLKLALDVLRENDTLVVWKLDRLGRSVRDLVNIVSDLEQRGVYFKSLTDQIDTSTTAGLQRPATPGARNRQRQDNRSVVPGSGQPLQQAPLFQLWRADPTPCVPRRLGRSPLREGI